MTTTQTSSKKTENKSAKKKQHTDIGSPKVPISQRKTNQQHEVLSDWNHAS